MLTPHGRRGSPQPQHQPTTVKYVPLPSENVMHVFLSFLPFEFLFGIKLLLRINDTYFRFFKQRRGQTVQPKKMERCGHVVMGRRMRHLRHLPSSGA